MTTPTFFWHDYETTGLDKQRDRAAQFAGVRTTFDLETIGGPVEIFCKPCRDVVPRPTAIALTGISPQMCEQKGLIEADFAKRVASELGAPGTCGVGYNTMRFDDEVTRNLLYRNFFDPYEREWRSGNSRWDLLHAVRSCYALRPEGIIWPEEGGQVSMKLEQLAVANGLSVARAHDAVSDVLTTVELARLVKKAQPGLWDFTLSLRQKQKVLGMVDMEKNTVLLHVSSIYSGRQHCVAAVMPLAWHPVQSNAFLAADLSVDPSWLLDCSVEDLAGQMFSRGGEGEDAVKTGVSIIHANRSPMLFPASTIKGADPDRVGMSLDDCRRHWKMLAGNKSLATKLQQALRLTSDAWAGEAVADAELGIYSGFASSFDKQLMSRVREATPAQLAQGSWPFQDPRYLEMLFRYRARNWPETLDGTEREVWDGFCRDRMDGNSPLTTMTLDEYDQMVAKMQADDSIPAALRQDMVEWGQNMREEYASCRPAVKNPPRHC